jgi:magnesium transporter
MRTDERTFVDQLRSLAKIDDPQVVRAELESLAPQDIAEALIRLPEEDALSLLQRMDEEMAAYVLVDLPSELTKSLLDELPDATVAHYLDILPMDDAIELKEDIPDDRFEALLEVIPQEDADEIQRLLAYPEESVGRLMTEDFVEARPDMAIRDVLKDIREKPEEEYETVNDIYVLDEERKLLGVFSLRRAVRANPSQKVREIMLTDPVTVRPDLDEEEAARIVSRYGFYAVPVVDAEGYMLGIFTVDDAHEILEEADTEDVLALGAVTGEVEAYLSLSAIQLVRRRLPWLVILFVAEFLTGAVLRRYTDQAEGTRTRLTDLMVFVPLLIGAGGNAGAQVTTTITRALALGEVTTRDALLVLRREVIVAMILGLILGGIGYLRAFFGWESGAQVSAVVGLALPAIVIWATTVGSLLPIGAKALKFDPAVMSAPFITTFVDATGLIIFFEIAHRIAPF